MSIRDTAALKPLALQIKATGAALGIGLTKTWELIKEKKLETISIGARRLVLVSSIERLIDELRAVEASRPRRGTTQIATEASLAARGVRMPRANINLNQPSVGNRRKYVSRRRVGTSS